MVPAVVLCVPCSDYSFPGAEAGQNLDMQDSLREISRSWFQKFSILTGE